MLKISAFFFCTSLVIIAGLLIHFNSAPVKADYVGVQSCQSCHSSLASGSIFPVWESGPHRSALQILDTDSAQAYLQSENISIDNCLQCHSTLGRKGQDEFEKLLHQQGIGCERCHGPGSQYIQSTIMKDEEMMERFGGSSGDLADCYSCHTKDPSATNDNHCPFQTSPFDAESAWATIKHSRSEESFR